jgi:hypothetical protein
VSKVENLRLIEDLMMETEDSLVLLIGSLASRCHFWAIGLKQMVEVREVGGSQKSKAESVVSRRRSS